MWTVLEAAAVSKELDRAPKEIQEKFTKWLDIARLSGPPGLRAIKGFKDHALKGEWAGARSSYLNKQWRVIYSVDSDQIRILVLRVTPHDYRKRS